MLRILSLIITLTLVAQAELATPTKRGAFRTLHSQHQGVKVIVQEGKIAPNWTQLQAPGWSVKGDQFRLAVAPTTIVGGNGKSGLGANVQLQLSNLVKLNHSSHFGAFERHQTMLHVTPQKALHLRTMRLSDSRGSNTRVGPVVKLGQQGSLWYGKSVTGGSDLLLVTGNFRF